MHYTKLGCRHSSEVNFGICYTESMKRLYRSRKERVIAGICGGIAQYMNLDPTLIRLVAVLLIMLPGAGLLAYAILWIVIPLEDEK